MKKTCLILLFLWMHALSPAFGQEPLVQPPKGDRLESERLFTEAYRSLVTGKYWNAENSVNESLEADPYNIDCYLLRALIRQRMGYTSKAIEDLSLYLEVRPRDDTVRQMKDVMEKFFLKPAKYGPTDYGAFSQSLKTFLNLNPFVQTGTWGVINGHSFGDEIALVDSLGETIQILSSKGRRDLKVKSPSDVFFIDRSHFVVLCKNGDVREFEDDGVSFNEIMSGKIDGAVSSIAFLSSSLFAVTRPLDRRVDFYSYPLMVSAGTWAPEGVEFFEPRDIAVRGDMIAVTDRKNDAVYIWRWKSGDPPITLKNAVPRSLEWGPTGDLIVLSDTGSVSIFARKQKWDKINRFELADSPCLFSSSDSILIPSYDGRYVTKITARPGKKEGVMFQMGLSNPKTGSVDEDRGQAVEVSVRISTPFTEYLESERGILTAVWRDTMVGGRILPTEVDRLDGVLLSKANRYRFNGDIWMAVETDEDVYKSLRRLWETTPRMSQLILDSSIKLGKGTLRWVNDFCVINGIAISVWATEIPEADLMAAVENTGGKVYYSDSLADSRFKDIKTKNFIFKIFYPDTVSSSGYPSKNMLSTIADFGMITYRGWLPVWPDMLR